jgi:hypothetical protein
MNNTTVPLNSLAAGLQWEHGGTMEIFLFVFKVPHLGLSMSPNTVLADAVCKDYFLAVFSRNLSYCPRQLDWNPSINPSTKVKNVNANEHCVSTVV